MSAELLRRAAKQMRERAEASTPSPWESFCPGSEGFDIRERTSTDYRSDQGYPGWQGEPNDQQSPYLDCGGNPARHQRTPVTAGTP
jgi:hypothetical protein